MQQRPIDLGQPQRRTARHAWAGATGGGGEAGFVGQIEDAVLAILRGAATIDIEQCGGDIEGEVPAIEQKAREWRRLKIDHRRSGETHLRKVAAYALRIFQQIESLAQMIAAPLGAVRRL